MRIPLWLIIAYPTLLAAAVVAAWWLEAQAARTMLE